MATTRPYLSVRELSADLGIDPGKILHWLHTGQLAGINVAENPSGRPRWRIPREAWEQFQSARSNQAPPPQRRRRRRRTNEAIIQFFS